MTFRIATDLLAQIVAEAAASPGVEVCGLLLGTSKIVEKVLPCRNVADDQARAFEIDPAALLAAHRASRAGGAKILGCYHSHPTGDAEPSARDANSAAANGWLWVIAAKGNARIWRAVPQGTFHGRFDECSYGEQALYDQAIDQ